MKAEGYNVTDACRALGVSRSGYYYRIKANKGEKRKRSGMKDMDLLEKIKAIKGEHPFWGYRRVWAWLRHREGICVNQKRIRRIMKENDLMVKQKHYRAKRVAGRSKPRADRPFQYWGIDMTKFMIESIGWVYLVVVLDWFTKKIVGWSLSIRGRSAEWKKAIDRAVEEEFPEGVRGSGLKLISDNGAQPTSISFMKDMATLGIKQIFTSYDNPKGNADTERVMRTIKEELIWIEGFQSFEEAKRKISRWIEVDYNKLYVHSQLGYMSPEEYEGLYYRDLMAEAA